MWRFGGTDDFYRRVDNPTIKGSREGPEEFDVHVYFVCN